MNKRVLFLLSILVMLALACSLTSLPGATQVPGATPQGGADQPTGVPQPAGTPPANPVTINDGLGSLNSYVMTVSFNNVGPDPAEFEFNFDLGRAFQRPKCHAYEPSKTNRTK